MVTNLFIKIIKIIKNIFIFLFYPKYKIVKIKFHKDKKGGHPHIVFKESNKKILSVGLTTSPKKNDIKLKKDPLDGNKQSYIKPNATVDFKYMYNKKDKVGNMHKKDYNKAKKIANKKKNNLP